MYLNTVELTSASTKIVKRAQGKVKSDDRMSIVISMLADSYIMELEGIMARVYLVNTLAKCCRNN